MTLFEQGIALVIEHLKNAQNRGDLRARKETLERLAALKYSIPVERPVIREELAVDENNPQRDLTPAMSHVIGTTSSARTWDELRSTALQCTKCPHLVKFRHSVVFGVGDPKAELMFIGEAPGADEDRLGEPFVGRAGELLTKIIQTMGFRREEVYIANVLKCRPDIPPGAPGNRQPTALEMETCLPYLREQIELIKPKIMVALGSVAMKGLLGSTDSMKNLRGRWHTFQSIPVMATFHPSYLLRNQALSEKRKVWEDMLLVLERLEKPISEKQRYYFMSR